MLHTIQPRDEQELVECLAESGAQQRRLEVVGGASRRGVLGEVDAEAVLDVSLLSGVIDYDPTELVLTARAGTPLHEIESLVREQHQMLAFEPPVMCKLTRNLQGVPTIGGAISANAAGPRRIAAGAARDHFLGFRAVSGSGEAFKGGGRVVKNVTGFDLSKLLAGSWGSLAVLTEVSVKVMPRPRYGATLVLAGLNADSACKAMAHSLTLPCFVSAAAFLPEKAASRSPVDCATSLTILRLEGFQASVATRARSLIAALESFGDVVQLPDDLHASLWEAVGEVAGLLPSDGPVLRTTMPADAASRVAAQLDPDRWMMDWGGGLIWHCDADAPTDRLSTHIQCWREQQNSPVELRPLLLEPHAALMRSLKAKFDPCNILNRGRLLSDANTIH